MWKSVFQEDSCLFWKVVDSQDKVDIVPIESVESLGDVNEEGEKLELISLQVSLLVALNNHLEREDVVVNKFTRRAELPFGQEGCLAHQRPEARRPDHGD